MIAHEHFGKSLVIYKEKQKKLLFNECLSPLGSSGHKKKQAREKETRERERELPHPSRVSLARARSLFHPLLPSARYVGYECLHI